MGKYKPPTTERRQSRQTGQWALPFCLVLQALERPGEGRGNWCRQTAKLSTAIIVVTHYSHDSLPTHSDFRSKIAIQVQKYSTQ